jgi:hypothetical protein
MRNRRRLVLAGTALLLLASAIGAPAASAAPRAPKFDVTTNVDRVPGYNNRVFLRIRFKSTMVNRKTGFVRFVIPVQTFVRNGFQRTETWGPGLQRTDPLENGYFRVEKGSCERAKVDGFLTHLSNVSKKWIDIKFDCKPGRSFALLWYPTSIWWDMDGTLSSDEPWTFPVRTRFRRDDRWTSRRGPTIAVTASPIFITPPNIWYTEPKRVVAVEPVPEPPVGNAYIEITGTFKIDVTPLSQELHLVNPVRMDTGESVLVVAPQQLRMERTITVTGCLPGPGIDCTQAPFGVVTVENPVTGTFSDPQGNLLDSQVAVLFGVNFAQFSTEPYDEAETTCGYHGGGFYTADGAILGTLWNCEFWLTGDADARQKIETHAKNALEALSTKGRCPTFVTEYRQELGTRILIACATP